MIDSEPTPAAAPIRVLLVDDQALIRMGFRLVLDAEPDLEIVGEAGDGQSAAQMVKALSPDVVLMDVRMPTMDGIESTRLIVESGSNAKVLILTTFDLDEYAFAALRVGASGFLLKDARPAELTAAIRTVHAGEAAVSPRITRRLLELFAVRLPDTPAAGASDGSGDAMDSRLADLTGRELELLGAVAEGLSNAEISEKLFISEATVKTHVGRILAKTGSRDRTQLVVLAYETGLVRPGNPGTN